MGGPFIRFVVRPYIGTLDAVGPSTPTEMLYVAFRYRRLLPEESRKVVASVEERFAGVQEGDPTAPGAVDDIETVKGSIERQIKKLPKWLQRVLEVLMELLKLTKGMIH